MLRILLLERGGESELSVTAISMEPTIILFWKEYSTIASKEPYDWAEIWVPIFTVDLNLRFCNVTYEFQVKSTVFSCLTVAHLLAQKRIEIWSLSNCN